MYKELRKWVVLLLCLGWSIPSGKSHTSVSKLSLIFTSQQNLKRNEALTEERVPASTNNALPFFFIQNLSSNSRNQNENILLLEPDYKMDTRYMLKNKNKLLATDYLLHSIAVASALISLSRNESVRSSLSLIVPLDQRNI